MFDLPIFRKDFRIKILDTRFDLQASFPAMAGYMQETALHHVEALEMGMRKLQSMKITWFLTRIKIQVFHYPVWNDHIHVATWSPKIDRLYAHREFTITDESERIIAISSSKYILFDLTKNRPLPTQSILGDYNRFDEKRNFPELPGKLFLKEDKSKSGSIRVEPDHIDANHHANNVHYISWIINSIPVEFQTEYLPETFDIYYMGSGRLYDLLDVYGSKKIHTENGKIKTEHCIKNSADGAELIRVSITWSPGNI